MSDDKIKESGLWKWLSGARRLLKGLHLQRIETSTGSGVPDVEGCLLGRSFWIELKTIARPKRFTTGLTSGLSREQVMWLEDRHRAGGQAFVLLQVGSASGARRYLIPAPLADWVHTKYPTEAELSSKLGVLQFTSPDEVILRAVYRVGD